MTEYNKYQMGNNFFIGEELDEEFGAVFPQMLATTIQENSDPVLNIWINSYGGFTHTAFQIIDLIEIAKLNGIVVNTIVNFAACSAGSLIATIGSPGHRFIAPRGHHLIHYGSISGEATTPRQVDRVAERQKRNFANIIGIYEVHANVPDIIKHMEDDEYCIPADKCIEYGLADKLTTEWVIEQ